MSNFTYFRAMSCWCTAFGYASCDTYELFHLEDDEGTMRSFKQGNIGYDTSILLAASEEQAREIYDEVSESAESFIESVKNDEYPALGVGMAKWGRLVFYCNFGESYDDLEEYRDRGIFGTRRCQFPESYPEQIERALLSLPKP